ncbi:restriction endonuclease subunit S [Exiguobacterium qingdaonense]|uniref:restriction endonuclease subunit S n=1 Tax=Exiguobacterium qingdaonense TaxID=2751251 RepID=UPI001BE4E92A|nr:restriction endonuclease subunit S [Exiguobacterium qingdaonense]
MSIDTSIWYESLPDKWISIKLKYIVDLRNEKIFGGESQNYIGLENIESKTGKFLPSINSEINIEGISNQFYKGDILFGKLRPYLAKCVEAEFDGVGTTELLALKGNTKLILSKYLKFMMLSPKFIDYINSSTYGTKMPRASWDFIGNIEVPLPSISHQQIITDFITSKMSNVDRLILQKEHLINLLEQQRQSIITEAVTKGLNPNVKMKDSGVEWIGKIPDHWKLVKIKNLIVSKKGAVKTGPFGSQLTNNDMNGNDVKIYNQRTVLDNDFVKGDYYISKEKYDELKSFELYPGDIVITTRGSIGKAAIVPNNIECGILHPCLIRMQLCPNLIEFKLIEIIFNETNFIKKQIEIMSNSTTIEVIYSETLKNLSIVLPSKEEQQELLIYIENILKDYNRIIFNQKKQVEKLKEYRQSLIYEAVTGKIDVREMEID